MEREEEGQSKEQYVVMKKHDESKKEGSMFDVTTTRGSFMYEPDMGLKHRLKQGFEGPSTVLKPYPASPNFSISMTHPSGVQAAFRWQ